MFDLPLFEAHFMTFYSASAVGLRHGCWWMPIALVLRWVSMRWIPQHLQSWSSSSKHPRFAAELPCGRFFFKRIFLLKLKNKRKNVWWFFFLGGDLIWRVFFLDEQWDLFNFWVIAHAFYEASACFFLGPTHSSAKLFVEAIAQRSGFERSIWRLTFTHKFLHSSVSQKNLKPFWNRLQTLQEHHLIVCTLCCLESNLWR